jgi:hypothetical protein
LHGDIPAGVGKIATFFTVYVPPASPVQPLGKVVFQVSSPFKTLFLQLGGRISGIRRKFGSCAGIFKQSMGAIGTEYRHRVAVTARQAT